MTPPNPQPPQGGEQKPRFAVNPYPCALPMLVGCYEVEDAENKRWFCFTQKRQHADEIVTALSSHASLSSRVKELTEALGECVEQLESVGDFLSRKKAMVDLRGGDGPIFGTECRRKAKSARALLPSPSSGNPAYDGAVGIFEDYGNVPQSGKNKEEV